MSFRAFIGLGSNLNSPQNQVERACLELNQHKHVSLVQRSPWYGSNAVGPGNQPDYVNGVAEIKTSLTAPQLLSVLQELEHRHHRTRAEHWGARTLDLDLLWYAGQNIDFANLQVPHPRMSERNFVLFPLRDIAPDLIIQDNRSVKKLAEQVSADGIWPLRKL